MYTTFLSKIDLLSSKLPLLNRAIEGVVNILLNKAPAAAACSGTYYCGTTPTGQYCDMCIWVSSAGQCMRLYARRVNIWVSNRSNCSDMCISHTECEAGSLIGPCSPCAI